MWPVLDTLNHTYPLKLKKNKSCILADLFIVSAGGVGAHPVGPKLNKICSFVLINQPSDPDVLNVRQKATASTGLNSDASGENGHMLEQKPH